MSAPSHQSLQAQIDHLDAAMAGISDAIANGDARAVRGKGADPLRSIKQARLDGFAAVRKTLVWVRDNEPAIRSSLSSQTGRAA
jgi:hypothetical protein